MYVMTRRLEFDAGHRVPLHESKCKTPHGHRYVAEVTCVADTLTNEGFVVDFGVVKRIVGGWIDANWDHTMIFQAGDLVMVRMRNAAMGEGLREWYELPDAPTAENMAKYLFAKADELLSDERVTVQKVVIWETPNCSATWTG